jgi:tetratricopeptide (TPR) repeat protein
LSASHKATVAFILFACVSAHAMPRPVTAAEKAACEAVADHLDRGAIAIAERSGLRVEDAEARVGPHADAQWELKTADADFAEHGAVFHVIFPSGVDDVIAFEMQQQGGKWRITSIRTLADAAPAPPPPVSAAPSAAAAIAMVIVVARKRRWPWVAGTATLLAVATAIAIAWPKRTAPEIATIASTPADTQSPYAGLLPLRRAIATASPLPPIGVFNGETRDIALLWKAQRDIGRVPAEDIEKQLYAVERRAPLKALIAARLAASSGKDSQALEHFDEVRKAQPQHDAFWWEEEMSSPRESSIEPLRRMVRLQSRDAGAYYLLAIEHFLEQKRSEAVAIFHQGLSLRPVARATVVGSGILALLPRDWSSSALIDISAPDEPKQIDGSLSRNAMAVPQGTKSTAAGSFVRLAIREGRLDLPYGAPIAPAGTEVITGEEMDRQEADEAVARASTLSEAALASGAVQHTIENAIDALAAHNRWGDIIRLTDSIGPQSDNASPDLFVARVRALVHMKHFAAARDLATSAAARRLIQRHPSAFTVAELAELLAQADAYDEAVEMYRSVKEIPGAPDMTARATQVALRRTLNMSSLTAQTAHFEIHSMPEVPPAIPAKIGAKLEADLQMMMGRFALRNFRTVRVNVLRWDDFRWSVTGSDYVVGFYDGDLTIPWGTLFFGLGSDSVTTHELTHAVVAQASNDNAPRWFQEGVAQRMENSEKPEKIVRLVALSLLDAMLQGSADIDDISSAYGESLRVVRFLEARYGPQSINKMIAAYRGGASNEEAFRSATGKTVPDVDREFRTWYATHHE